MTSQLMFTSLFMNELATPGQAGLLACFVSGADLAEAAQYGCLTGAN